MVNRNHKKFPIKADFKGISLSTSLNDHVKVVLDDEKSGIYLS
jgi:pyrimidine operon attenuation protein/uracil phosphoribosyltransferase